MHAVENINVNHDGTNVVNVEEDSVWYLKFQNDTHIVYKAYNLKMLCEKLTEMLITLNIIIN